MKNRGITLIALVITIIVLLILAGVTLSLTLGENGILQKARTAKIDSEIAREKEQILLAMNSSFGDDGKNAKVIDKNKMEQNLQATEGKDNVKLIADIEEDDSFYVKFINTNRYYEIDPDRNVTLIEVTGGEKNLKLICVNSTNTVLFEKTYIILKDNFSKKLPEIEGYVAPQERITGTITQDEEMKVTYYFAIPESDLIFTGLDKNGNITNDSSKIVSYMIGDNSNNTGNGIIGNPSSLAALKVPETHNGKPVTKIGKNSFYYINSIAIVIICNNVTTIEDSAFYNCNKITTVTIGSGLTTLNGNGFKGCSKIKTVIYNNTTNAIKNLGTSSGCGLWDEIQISSGNTAFKVVDNILYSKDGSKIIKVPKGKNLSNYTIPNGVKTIGEYSFYSCEKLISIDIGTEVTKIEGGAFENCIELQTVTLGENLTELNGSAFRYCSKLKKVIYNNITDVIKNFATSGGASIDTWTEIEINEGNTAFKVEDNILYSKDGSKIVKVPTGKMLGNYVIPSGVTIIGNSSFYNCLKLTSINIGSEVTSIKSSAFENCSEIINVTLGSGLTELNGFSFRYCSKLKKIVYNNTTDVIKNVGAAGGASIGTWTEIEINEGNTAFKVVDNILYSKDGSKIVKVPTGKDLADFTIPSGVTQIGESSFYNCSKLTSINIEPEITSIGGSAFRDINNLRTIILAAPTITANLIKDYSCGYLVNYATTVYTNSTPGAYIIDNFNVVTSDKAGYTKYVKK